jgi:hypothetical protein
LIALPALVLAEIVVAPRLQKIAQHFVETGLITAEDRPRFDAAISSTRRLKNSFGAVIVLVLLAWGLVPLLLLAKPTPELLAWQSSAEGRSLFSPAGWWHLLVSMPLLLFVLLGWVWRLLLWTRFLWRVSRLDLQLVPAHPDRAAGLMFVAHSLRVCSMLGFAVGAIVAGPLRCSPSPIA